MCTVYVYVNTEDLQVYCAVKRLAKRKKSLVRNHAIFFASIGGYQEIRCHFPPSNANVNTQQIKIRTFENILQAHQGSSLKYFFLSSPLPHTV
jgi:hypothetical protein